MFKNQKALPYYYSPPCTEYTEQTIRNDPARLRAAGLPFLTEEQRNAFTRAALYREPKHDGEPFAGTGITLSDFEEDRRNQQILASPVFYTDEISSVRWVKDGHIERRDIGTQASGEAHASAPSMYSIDQSESVRWVHAGHIRSRTVGIQSATTFDQRTEPAKFKARSQGFRRADEITFGLALPGQREFRIYTHIAMGYQEYDPALEHTALHADPLPDQRGDFGEAHASASGPSSSTTSQQMPARDLGDEQLPRRRRGRAANSNGE